MMAGPPLSVLLSKTLDALSRELDGRRDPGAPPLAVWANVLNHIDEDGVDQRDLPRLASLSKRAVLPALKPLGRSGHIAIRDKHVRLTPLGRTASEVWVSVQADAERQWRRRFGAQRMTSLRRELEHVASHLDLRHPDFPTQYGTADPRINGGPGKDWKPVPRAAGATAKGDMLTSLLSQALVEVTMEYDRRAGPLQFAANVLRFVPDKGTAVSELPDTHWLGTMVRHQFVKLSADETRVRLSPMSKNLRDAYLLTLLAIENEWQSRFGKEHVENLRSALDAIVARVDPDDELPHLMSLSLMWSGARWSRAESAEVSRSRADGPRR